MNEKTRGRRQLVAFLAFWGLGAALMAQSYLAEPPDPALHGTAAYGTSYAGELQYILLITAGEVLVLLLLLRPWSYRRSWGRALIAFVLFTPWMLLWGALGLHAGPATHAHTMWLMLTVLGLGVATLVSASSAAAHRRDASRPAG